MEKSMRFVNVAVGNQFRNGNTLYTKKSASSAVNEEGRLMSNIKLGTEVFGIFPDPTPEELAAQEASRQADIERWARRALDTGIESARTTLDRFAKRLAEDPADAFSWGSSSVEAAGTLRVYSILAELFDKKGYQVAKDFALRRALEGARSPQHSTSELSNAIEEAFTAAYARFASNNL